MKVAIVCALLAGVAMADHPGPHHAGPHHAGPHHAAPHHPAPYNPAPYKEAELPPQPFAYQYGVKDDYSGAAFEKNENQDSYGNLQGSYRVALPDGRTQIVTYKADQENGFIADVAYEGTAVYPPEPKEGYGAGPKPYAPAPKYPVPAYVAEA